MDCHVLKARKTSPVKEKERKEFPVNGGDNDIFVGKNVIDPPGVPLCRIDRL